MTLYPDPRMTYRPWEAAAAQQPPAPPPTSEAAETPPTDTPSTHEPGATPEGASEAVVRDAEQSPGAWWSAPSAGVQGAGVGDARSEGVREDGGAVAGAYGAPESLAGASARDETPGEPGDAGALQGAVEATEALQGAGEVPGAVEAQPGAVETPADAGSVEGPQEASGAPEVLEHEVPEVAPRDGGDSELLHLSSLLGAGVVRVDAQGVAWPQNETGLQLLVMLGGAGGAPLPELLRELVASAEHGGPQQDEMITQVPESKHIGIVASNSGSGGLIMLRDQTDERLLQERLLQSEKMASVGQLVSGVAHELNNPLTGVMGFAQLLLGRDLDETTRSQVQTIYGEAERAAKIVQNLLSFARRRKPSKEMADVNALLQRVLELRSYDFTARGISLDMTLDTRMEKVWADPDQIQQVLFNVIKNAEQAMLDANGGGKLTVVTRGHETGVRVSVIDNGPGIPPEIARRIFDPFFTTKEAGEGTGLGLTICYSIIDEHGGRIWTENLQPTLENPDATGTVFHIDLPVGVEEAPVRTGAGPAAGGQTAVATGRRVLVVDDEWSIRALLHDILRLDHHEVALASSGIEAADLVERERFDIILTDYKMPGMDGASFYRHLLERDPAQARRPIFITGDTVSPDTRSFLQGVSNPVLSKPFKIGPLRDAIEVVLGQAEVRADVPAAANWGEAGQA